MSPPPSSADPGQLRWLLPPTLEHMMHPSALFLLHRVDLELLASPKRSGFDLRSGSRRLLSPPNSHLAGSPHLACYACLRWSRYVCFAGGAVVKSSPGSLWPAARALPRHAVQTYAWAYGERVLLLLPLSSLLWPWLLAIWPWPVSQAHRPISMMLFTDVSLWCWIQLAVKVLDHVVSLLCSTLCQWTFLTEMLYWILPCCNVQLTPELALLGYNSNDAMML
jgi:hypothetical protein